MRQPYFRPLGPAIVRLDDSKLLIPTGIQFSMESPLVCGVLSEHQLVDHIGVCTIPWVTSPIW